MPGSAFAIFVLHAVLVTPCDDLLRVHQRLGLQTSVRIAKYVDDLAISVQGKCSDANIRSASLEAVESVHGVVVRELEEG